MDSAHIAVTKAMALYFDGLYYSDVIKLSRVFHPKAVYVCATDSNLVYKTMTEYFPIVAAREAPAKRNEVRRDTIATVEFAGPSTAFVKAHCAIGPKFFTDFLIFIKDDAQWRIISKVFHYELMED